MLDNLQEEYKQQDKILHAKLKEIEEKIDSLSLTLPDYDFKFNDLCKERNTMIYCIRNIRFGDKWMELAHEPGRYQGIENRILACNYEDRGFVYDGYTKIW